MDVLARISRAIGRPVAEQGVAADNAGHESAKTSNDGTQSSGGEVAGNTSRLAKDEHARKAARRADREAQRSFHYTWQSIHATLSSPDQAALHHGVARTDLPERLQDLCDALVFEANRASEDAEMTGPCMEMLLEKDVLGQLVRLTANDRLPGTQVHIVRLFAELTILLDERFLSRQAVHRPLVRLLRICVGDDSISGSGVKKKPTTSDEVIDPEEDDERRAWRRFGRAGSAEILGFEEDLVNLLCHIASRLRTTPDLLIIFFRERGGDDETRKAFNRAMTGVSSSNSTAASSRNSTRPSSPTVVSPTARGTTPAVSSPLRPSDTPPLPISPKSALQSTGTPPHSSMASTQAGLPFDFPLFSYLMRFIHRESRTGELARAGILFLIDVAFAPGRRNSAPAGKRSVLNASARGARASAGSAARQQQGSRSSSLTSASPAQRVSVNFGLGPSTALARFIVEADFSEVLGASVGAVYGLLPTKLSLSPSTSGKGGTTLGERKAASPVTDTLGREIEASTSTGVRMHARLLCDLIEFTQDVLRTACKLVPGMSIESGTTGPDGTKQTIPAELASAGRALTNNICACLSNLFLESILYPTMLECSDTDGSAVAVMTYLDAMLSVLEDDSPLTDCIVGWLVATDDLASKGKSKTTAFDNSILRQKKHKSTAMLQIEEKRALQSATRGSFSYYSDTLGRYTIRDLILDNMQPGVKAMASIAALRLASTLLKYHGRHAVATVLKVTVQPDAIALSSVHNMDDIIHQYDSGDANDENDHLGDDTSRYQGAKRDGSSFSDQQRRLLSHTVSGVSAWQYTTEMELYISLVSEIERCSQKGEGGKTTHPISRSTSFDNYIEDAELALLQDSMFRLAIITDVEQSLQQNDTGITELAVGLMPNYHRLISSGNTSDLSNACNSHHLQPTDRLMRTAIQMLCSFWKNSPEVNVSLMGFMAAVASCPARSLNGLFAFPQVQQEEFSDLTLANAAVNHNINEEEDEDTDDRSDDERAFAANRGIGSTASKGRKDSERKSSSKKTKTPVVVCVLRALLDQMQSQRARIKDFDRFLSDRRQGLLYLESLDDALRTSNPGDDNEGAHDASKGAFSAFTISSREAQERWRSCDIASQVDGPLESGSGESPRHLTLPVRPSATESQGLPVASEGKPGSETPGNIGLQNTSQNVESRSDAMQQSTFARLFGRGRHARTPSSAISHGEQDADVATSDKAPSPRPFAQHYQETSRILVHVDEVRLVPSNPWSLRYDPTLKAEVPKSLADEVSDQGGREVFSPNATTRKRTRFLDVAGRKTTNTDLSEDAPSSDNLAESTSTGDTSDSFLYPGQDGDDPEHRTNLSGHAARAVQSLEPPMLLSTLLDNVIVLEESIKELVAILHVRRALGIDPILFM